MLRGRLRRKELGLDVGKVSGGGHAREGSPMQETSHTEGHIGKKGCQGCGTCTVKRVVQRAKEFEGGQERSATGPSGITSEHMKLLSERVECSRLFGEQI